MLCVVMLFSTMVIICVLISFSIKEKKTLPYSDWKVSREKAEKLLQSYSKSLYRCI